MDSHALDAALGRAAVFAALAALVGPALHPRLPVPPGYRRWVPWAAFALGMTGALVTLNAFVLSVGDTQWSEPTAWRPELRAFADWVWPALVDSRFGHWWLAQVAGLATAVLLWHRPGAAQRARWAGVAVGIYSMARMGHGAEFGPLEFWMWVHVVHTGAVVAWLGGLGVMSVVCLHDDGCRELGDLRPFSRWMLAAMIVILITGAARTAALLPWEAAAMRGLYVWILIAKVAIVLVLLPIAYRLRHRIFIARETALPSTDLRNPLTGELFLAALILFASTLLSQQSPP